MIKETVAAAILSVVSPELFAARRYCPWHWLFALRVAAYATPHFLVLAQALQRAKPFLFARTLHKLLTAQGIPARHYITLPAGLMEARLRAKQLVCSG
jgi:hypothetical protein